MSTPAPRPAASLILATAALLALTACDGTAGGEAKAKRPPDAIPVVAGVAHTRSISALYRTSATLRAAPRATVTARSRGVVKRFLVEEGDRVTEGQALCELDREELAIEAKRAETAQAERERAWKRSQGLFKRKALSVNDLERARRELDDAGQRLALARLLLNRATLQAPFAGRIVRRYLDPGALVEIGTAVLDLADLDPLYADVSVPERHVARLAKGQTVRLMLDATRQVAPATIERIAPVVNAATGTIKVTVSTTSDSIQGLRAGAFVRVEIVTDVKVGALVVPRAALVAQGRGRHLFRIEGDHVEKLSVSTGFEERDEVELLEVRGRLVAGDRVVTVGAAALRDGARVEVRKP